MRGIRVPATYFDTLGINNFHPNPVRQNDGDGDWLVDEVPIAPTDIIVDSLLERSVWKIKNEVHDVAYNGDLVADPWTIEDHKGVMNAHEKDVSKFANDND